MLITTLAVLQMICTSTRTVVSDDCWFRLYWVGC